MNTLHFLPFSIRPPTFSHLTHKKNGISTFFQTPPISLHSKPFLSHLPHPNNNSSSSNNPFSSSLLSMASAPSSTSSQSVAPGDVDSSADFHQLVQAHQAAAARLPPLEEIRTLLDRSTRGMLSTFSQKHEGYPSGSMVDFACDHDGFPILAVSSLAVHTKDLLANPKCSLLVAKDPEDRTDLVITLHGDAISVAESNRVAIRTAYLRRHPNAFWVDFGDFQFMRIEPKVVRYVSGVATALLGSGEFGTDEYKAAKVDPINQFSAPVASHMNKDHAEDTKAIVQHSTSIQVDFAHMLDLDSLGFYVKENEPAPSRLEGGAFTTSPAQERHKEHESTPLTLKGGAFTSASTQERHLRKLSAGYQGNTLKLRIPFPRRAEDRKDVKTLIVEMLQAAKASGRAT